LARRSLGEGGSPACRPYFRACHVPDVANPCNAPLKVPPIQPMLPAGCTVYEPDEATVTLC
jgi:hypothetical protein